MKVSLKIPQQERAVVEVVGLGAAGGAVVAVNQAEL